MIVPEITRYEVSLGDTATVIPAAYGHLVYFTDHDLVVDQLLERIRYLECELNFKKEPV